MPHTNPRERKAYYRKYYAALSPEKKALKLKKTREYQESSHRKEATRRNLLLRKYGITPEQYDAMFESQGKACAICKSETTKYRWCVDHCHVNGIVRAILCHQCNLMIGHAEDNDQRLIDAAFYLLKHRSKQCRP